MALLGARHLVGGLITHKLAALLVVVGSWMESASALAWCGSSNCISGRIVVLMCCVLYNDYG